MRAYSIVAPLGATAAIAIASPSPSLSFDDNQFCQAMTEIGRAGNAHAGTWVDRHARHDGIDALCNFRTVHFKKFLNASASGLLGSWKERKKQEWNRIHCSNPIWREAIDNGWIISSTITTSAGEQVWFAATCK